MPDTYATAAGFVQFDVDTSTLTDGQTVRKITIRTLGTDGILITGTLWPEFDDVEVNKNDFVAIDGKFTERDGKNKQDKPVTYRDINISKIAVTPAAAKRERTVANKQSF